ncbi:serralysin [Sinorhizobium meliloti]|uniref:calcium-binding protein n=1 Tax=Rhizobium meliloti TaxID=382 RepID=UPI001199B711|nr:calcium-binding protein [Sinorhizobium meliloti]MDE3817794.1 calcium-binding protein [Sinorhizobium meliloti]QPI24064.1 calcium-binding protein [Sinorhizobium meliloti]TWB03401.1 putative secreted protein (type I secretion substrate) [Ensifer sp. SEMIA 134]TWB39280.1 putative secreted protein (type I secretion substrate) [Ensifer sp. SEMIA 135]
MATRIYGTNYADIIKQNGYIAIEIYAYDGDDDIYLNRTDSYGGYNFVDAGYGNDLVVNSYEGGNDIYLGGGNDIYVADIRVRDASSYDIVYGGSGNDRFEIEGYASDYYGESGNDTFFSVGFNNYFNGGTGTDTISYQFQDDWSAERGKGVTIDLGYNYATTGSGRREDLISIENATGTNYGRDDITGSAVANTLRGLGGHDIIEGLGGNDVLDGGSGDDDLYGGSGADILRGGTGFDYLVGGTGTDSFDFNSISESAVGSRRDVITDFHRSEFDVIDLSTIDADTTWSGNQSFTYIGGNAFSGEAGELNFRSGIISGDVNGDGYADFQVRVNGATSLRVDDFFL